MKLQKKIVCLVVLLLVTVGLTGCQWFTSGDKEQVVRLGMLPIEDNLPFYIAEAEGMFEAAGIKVELIPFDSALQRDTALQGGQIDGEIADLIAVGLLKKGGTDIKVVSIGLGATVQEGRFAILSSPNSGINSPQQLAGGTIGISQNTIIEFLTDQLLDYYGVARDQVEKQQIPQIPVRMEALLADQISAALLPDPLATLAEYQGGHVVADVTTIDINLPKTVLLFREDSIASKRDAIAKVIAIYEEAGQMLTNNPESFRELFIEKARVPKPIQDFYQPPTFSPLQLPGQAEFDRVMSWMVEKDLISEPFKYQELVTNEFIK